jgi:hypothetical protein
MTRLIVAAFKLLDAILEQTAKLTPEEAADARARLKNGMAERAARIDADEAADLAAIPKG